MYDNAAGFEEDRSEDTLYSSEYGNFDIIFWKKFFSSFFSAPHHLPRRVLYSTSCPC